ncbi:hypothetical protein PQX77_008204 [Marasmius sp. AFHP31]|nr:hypothetical protein PQX77_008263 [Marasmius sp. AFHP31]KAK1228710.1 hypothetical protein PQX77_008204 [Marasmius sp. AFHP31]
MSAPSFSSFHPSFESFPDFEAGPSITTEKSSSKKKKDKSKSERRDKDERKKRKHRERSPPPSDHHYDDKKVQEGSSRYFYSDTKGDALNVQYGGLHKGDIPKYHVINHGRKVLGLAPGWSARKLDIGIVVERDSDRNRLPTLTDAKTRQKLAETPELLLSSVSSNKYIEIDGFLRLPSEKDPDYREDTDSPESDSEIEGSLRLPENDNPKPHLDSVNTDRATLRSLEQDIKANPSSVSSWLALVSRTVSGVDPNSKKATNARAEIAISILDRAFSAHPKNKDSKRLRLKYLRAGAEIWVESKIAEEWEDLLKQADADIWMEWLEWKISKTSDLPGVFDYASRILGALGDREDDDMGKVRVLWRVAVACHQAGYSERATALFQAEAELLFEIPQSLHGLPIDTVLDGLEGFWDSEVPRIGEPGSKGWTHWYSRRDTQQPVPITPSKFAEAVDLDPYRQWGINESLDDRRRAQPLRSSDNSDDPYATILLSDLRQILSPLQSDRAKRAFRLAWLSFLGLPIPGLFDYLAVDDGSLDDRWSLGHLTTPSYLDAIFPPPDRQLLTTDAVSGVIIGRQKEYANSFGPVKYWTWGSLDPLEPVFSKHGMWDKVDVAGVDTEQVRRIFQQLRLGREDIEWDTLALAFEAALDVKVSLKLSRSLLENARDSLAHWAAHGKLERMRGRLNDARKVYQTVLVASSSSRRRLGEGQLWWDWAEMEWSAGQPEAALSIVLKAAGIEGRGGVAILRAKSAFSDEAKTCEGWKEAESWTKLGALLEVLASNDVASCQQMFDERMETLRIGEVAHESMTVQALLFLYTHTITLKNPVPPVVLRERAERALEMYPSNSVVLGVFLECEKGQGVWGRVRSLLSNSGETVKDVSRRIQEVWIGRWEGHRWESELERIRGSLAGAVEHERTQKSEVVWRVFIELEIRSKRLDQAKKLLYRGIQECPLSKELYLLAFVSLRSVFSGRELNSLAELMAERGIRMRRELDEVVADWNGADKSDEEGAMGGEDEIEYNSRELRRLKPY